MINTRDFDSALSAQENTTSVNTSPTINARKLGSRSRRQFLKDVASTGAGALLTNPKDLVLGMLSPKNEATKSKEKETSEPQALFIDFPLDFDKDEYILELMGHLGFEQNEVKEILRDVVELDTEKFRTDESYALAYGLHQYLSAVDNHGEMTSGAWQDTIHELQPQKQIPKRPEITPVLELFRGFQYLRLPDGGISIRFSVDPQAIPSDFFQNQTEVVNNSFLYGKQGVDIAFSEAIPFDRFLVYPDGTQDDRGVDYFFISPNLASEKSWEEDVSSTLYFFNIQVPRDDADPNSPLIPAVRTSVDGKEVIIKGLTKEEIAKHRSEYNKNPQIRTLEQPKVHVIEGYSDDATVLPNEDRTEQQKQNLESLFNLCKQHPQKLFVVAGGNYSTFFYDLLQQIGNDFPPNLLIVGLRLYTIAHGRSDGPNLFVNINLNKDKTGEELRGSSEATAIVSAVASLLAKQGLDSQSIQKLFLSDVLSSEKEYKGRNDEPRTARRLDMKKVKAYFQRE